MLKKFLRTHAPFIWSQINVKGYFLMFKKLNRNDAPFIWSQINVCKYFLMFKKFPRTYAPFVGAIPFLNATRKSFLTER